MSAHTAFKKNIVSVKIEPVKAFDRFFYPTFAYYAFAAPFPAVKEQNAELNFVLGSEAKPRSAHRVTLRAQAPSVFLEFHRFHKRLAQKRARLGARNRRNRPRQQIKNVVRIAERYARFAEYWFGKSVREIIGRAEFRRVERVDVQNSAHKPAAMAQKIVDSHLIPFRIVIAREKIPQNAGYFRFGRKQAAVGADPDGKRGICFRNGIALTQRVCGVDSCFQNVAALVSFRNEVYVCADFSDMRSIIVNHIVIIAHTFRNVNHLVQKIYKKVKEMENDDLIVRKEYPQVPPKVEYSLSKRGKSLMPVLDELCEWGEKNRK